MSIMDKQTFEKIQKYVQVLTRQSYSIGQTPKVYVCLTEGFFQTADGADLWNLKETDILPGDDGSIEGEYIKTNGENKALVISNTPYCTRCNVEKKDITSVLDDMAQIIGYKASVIPYEKSAVMKALKKSAGCLVADKYTISVGRNLFEAVTALTVLEKSAEVVLKAEVLGGGKKIPYLEALLMRKIYKAKYSKVEQRESNG